MGTSKVCFMLMKIINTNVDKCRTDFAENNVIKFKEQWSVLTLSDLPGHSIGLTISYCLKHFPLLIFLIAHATNLLFQSL